MNKTGTILFSCATMVLAWSGFSTPVQATDATVVVQTPGVGLYYSDEPRYYPYYPTRHHWRHNPYWDRDRDDWNHDHDRDWDHDNGRHLGHDRGWDRDHDDGHRR